MLSYKHVSVSVSGTHILEDIGIDFNDGNITTIVGPNGCGKTTLLSCLNSSAKVTAGNICINDIDFLKLPLKERAREVAFLPQIRTVIPVLPVRTLVEHGRFPYLGFTRRKSKEDIDIVNQSMDFTHVTAYSEQNADTLSGGIRQRVFFSMILAQDSQIIVMDEPVTYLDLEGKRNFFNMLKKLRQSGKTIILVLHELSDAIRISDNIVIMNDRKIVAHGTPDECISSHIIEDVFHTTYKKFSDEDGDYYIFL